MIVVAIDIGGTFTDLVGFDDKAGRIRRGEEPDHARTISCQGILDCIRKSGLRRRRHRRADPRLDHRHQHADRAQGRQDRADRHPRHARRLHHRPRQPAGSLQSVLPPAISRWCRATSPARSRSGCMASGEVARAAEQGERHRGLPRRSPPKASRRSRCASCTPTPIPTHERVAGAMVERGAAATPISRSRTTSCANIASSSASRRRWSTPISAPRSAAM